MSRSDYRIRVANKADLFGVLVVQLDAFGSVARELDIPVADLPPLNEPIETLERLMDHGTRFWIAEDADGRIIGSVRAQENGGCVEVGRLVVAQSRCRQGIGDALMAALEEGFPDAEVFELFTGKNAEAPVRLYEKRGYAFVREEITPAATLIWLEKRTGAST